MVCNLQVDYLLKYAKTHTITTKTGLIRILILIEYLNITCYFSLVVFCVPRHRLVYCQSYMLAINDSFISVMVAACLFVIKLRILKPLDINKRVSLSVNALALFFLLDFSGFSTTTTSLFAIISFTRHSRFTAVDIFFCFSNFVRASTHVNR